LTYFVPTSIAALFWRAVIGHCQPPDDTATADSVTRFSPGMLQ